MNMAWVRPLLRKSGQFLVRNSSHILMGVGTTASITAVIFGAKAMKSAEIAIRRAGSDKGDRLGSSYTDENGQFVHYIENLTIPETIKACWKCYVPAACMEMLALVCFWGAHGIDIRRQAVLAGLCTTAEEALREYQRKVQEMIGDKAEKEVKNAIAQDTVNALPPPQNVIFAEDTDLWWIIDGQYFRSNYIKIKDAQNDANHEMIQNMYISQSDVYWLLDPERKWLKPDRDSGQIGWSVDKMLVLDIDWGSDPSHKPVGIIKYRDKDGFDYPPSPGFSKML